MTEQDDLHLSTGAYALNSLEKHEKAAFEAYLAGSEVARTEVAEMSDTAALLGLSSRPVEPSPELKSAIMARLAVTGQLDTIPDTPGSPVATPTPPATAEPDARVRRLRNPLTMLIAAAAAVVLVATGAVIGLGAASKGPEGAQVDGLVELSAAEDLQQAVEAVHGGGTAKLIWSVDLKRSAMLIEGLPALQPDETYQLWYIDDAGATSAGTVTASGAGPTWRVLDGEMSGSDAVGLTVEPRGGSDEPTTDPLVVIGDAG